MAPTQKHFSVDARAVLTLGRESIKDHITALLELVKNSYDADATEVEVEVLSDQAPGAECAIRIADNGVGMTEEELESSWLRIGFSAKRQRLKSGRSRRVTGEKGIGRLSADRLGSLLEVRTKSKGRAPVGLAVDWSRFEQPGVDLQKVAVDVIDAAAIRIPRAEKSATGTELIIRNLRQDWTPSDLRALHSELSLFAPPLQAMPDFRIVLRSGLEELDGVVQSSFSARAQLEINLSLRKSGAVDYAVKGRRLPISRVLKSRGSIEWSQLTQGAESPAIGGDRPILGPAKVRLLFFPRKVETVSDSSLTLSDLRQFLDRHAGVRIYRDSVRVRPYGNPQEPEGDWLNLGRRKVSDPAGAARESFKVGPNQLVGAVFVGRDSNPELADSSGREGLIHNRAFQDLRRLVLGGVLLLERYYHAAFAEQAQRASRDRASPAQITSELRGAAAVLRLVKEAAEAGDTEALDRRIEKLPDVLEKLERVSRTADEVASQATVLRGLASLGIAGAVFGHETQASLAQANGSGNAALRLLTREPPALSRAIVEIEKAIEHSKRVATWGAFALRRVQRDKRTRRSVAVDRLAAEIAGALRPAFAASGIELHESLSSAVGRTFAMDVESVLLNLLTNAYSACQQTDRRRRVSLRVTPAMESKQSGVRLAVADSGPGVALEFREKIWEPLFTTRVGKPGKGDGTGLGLAIVQSIVDEHQGKRRVARDPDLKGALIEVWLPLK